MFTNTYIIDKVVNYTRMSLTESKWCKLRYIVYLVITTTILNTLNTKCLFYLYLTNWTLSLTKWPI